MRKYLVAGISALILATGLALGSGGTATAAPATVKPLDVCNFTSSRPTLSEGSSGTAVKQLQCYLNASLDDDHLSVDGQFGPKTLHAVREFQSCDGIGVDGIVGPITWRDLKAWANSAFFCDAGDGD